MKYISCGTQMVVHRDRAEARIFIIKLNAPTDRHPWGTRIDEHRFNPEFVSELATAVEAAESDPRVLGLMVVGEGKYFSNGMDTTYIRSQPNKGLSTQMDVERLMRQILCSRLTTVAVLNGHTTAAGAIFSLCFDYRVMGTRGLFFTPAVQLGIVYSIGMVEVVKSKISNPALLRDILLSSKRFDAAVLHKAGIVDELVDGSIIEQQGVDFLTQRLERNTDALAEVKKRLYSVPYMRLGDPTSPLSDMWWSRM